MTVPSHAVGDVDDVDDRLDALRKRLARGSDVSVTVGTAGLEGRVSPERLSRESSKELSVPPAASGPRDERPQRPRRAEPVDIMPSPTARSPRPSSPRSSTHRRWNAHYDVNTTPALTSPGGGRERAAAYGSPARFGIVPISPAPSLGVLAGDGDGRGRSIHDGRGDSTRHSTLRRHPRGDENLFGEDNRAAGRFATSIGDDVATVTMTLRERDEIHAKLVRLTGERDASRAECASLARNLSATTIGVGSRPEQVRRRRRQAGRRRGRPRRAPRARGCEGRRRGGLRTPGAGGGDRGRARRRERAPRRRRGFDRRIIDRRRRSSRSSSRRGRRSRTDAARSSRGRRTSRSRRWVSWPPPRGVPRGDGRATLQAAHLLTRATTEGEYFIDYERK